jgi:rubrerythrin
MMKLNTASEVISFAKRLEQDSAMFYEDLARRYAKDKDTFLSLAKENEKNIVQVERAYYGVITDAIEGCFSFNVNPTKYSLKTELAEKASYSEGLRRAIEIEEKIMKFYSEAAEQSKSLMADVPRAFKMIAKKRGNRQSTLKSLLGKED